MKKYILLTAIFISCVEQNLFAQNATNAKNTNSMMPTKENQKQLRMDHKSALKKPTGKKFGSGEGAFCYSTGNTTQSCKSTNDCDSSINAFCNVATEGNICTNFPLNVCLYSY